MLSLATASIIAGYYLILESPALPRRPFTFYPFPSLARGGGGGRPRHWVWSLSAEAGFCFQGAVVGRCGREQQDGGRDSGLDLKGRILEFMRASEFPDRFPTRRQLVEARGMDLAEAIWERGGWLSMGWDVDGKDATALCHVEANNGVVLSESARCDGDGYCMECLSDSSFELSRLSAEVDSAGIEGILSLLEKERNITFGETTNNSDSLPQHYDTWEFQENEILAAKDMLCSIRAKLSILEGKMALATSDAQKIVAERQKQIDAAHRALQHLRTSFVVWPNHANEVLLAGSFDGWTSQRRMERSSAGIFSLYLKLYPGRYEIKFVVDGVWKTDPLHPIVDNNGHKNNLLIIT